MTTPTLPLPAENSAPRPGSRAARFALPRAIDALKDLAIEHGVCIRPIALRRTDLTTGETELIDLPCAATLDAKCPPCAKRARHYRQVQIREGWYRTDEPLPPPAAATDGQKALISLRAHFEYGGTQLPSKTADLKGHCAPPGRGVGRTWGVLEVRSPITQEGRKTGTLSLHGKRELLHRRKERRLKPVAHRAVEPLASTVRTVSLEERWVVLIGPERPGQHGDVIDHCAR